MTEGILFADLDFHGNTYRVYVNGTAELIETRHTVPVPDGHLERLGHGPFWQRPNGYAFASDLTQKLNIIVGELEMRAREAVQS